MSEATSVAIRQIILECRDSIPEDVEMIPYIIACVNACKGLNPEAIPELVAALQNLVHAVDPDDATKLEPYFEAPVDDARQALSIARGEG